jgi:ABC-type nitrate/sulfonate/bicarbonate transport system permease component
MTRVLAPEKLPSLILPGTRAGRFWYRGRTPITRILATIIFLAVWEAAVRLGWVDPLFLASPTQVLARLIEVFRDGTIWPHLAASGRTAALGFLLSVVAGVPVGIVMGRSTFVRDTLEPFIMAQASIPTVALLPLLIIWLGIGSTAQVMLVFIGTVFGMIVSTEAGVRNIDQRLVETSRSFTATEWRILKDVVVPAALPYIVAGMRLSVSRVLIMVVVAELYASQAGIGYMIFQAGASYDTPTIFVGVMILAVAGILLNSGLRFAEQRLAPWTRS